MKNWQRAARMSLPVLLALALVACGDSDDTTTGTGDGSAAAAAAPDPVTTPPTEINVTTPLAAPPAAGKTLFWLQCELPICEKIGGGVKAAAEAAGWNYESLVFKSADPGSGIEAAVQQSPDVIAHHRHPVRGGRVAAEGCGGGRHPGRHLRARSRGALGGGVRRDLQPDHRARRRRTWRCGRSRTPAVRRTS